jgi:hypothetical protein
MLWFTSGELTQLHFIKYMSSIYSLAQTYYKLIIIQTFTIKRKNIQYFKLKLSSFNNFYIRLLA